MTQTSVKTRHKFDETVKREAVNNRLASLKSAEVTVKRMPSVFIGRLLLHVPARCHNRQRAREIPAAGGQFVFVSHPHIE